MIEPRRSHYRWYLLMLMTATGAFVSAIPSSCMPVLFKEISDDLHLDLVQIGTIWGITSLAGVFVSIIAGVLSDRFNMRLFISVSCVLVGITGALRGLSDSFMMLAFTVFINGLIRTMVPISVTKAVGIWFKGEHLGLAMGIGAMGMGFGLMLGPMISATWLSPALGGWRNVLYFYGLISVAIGILWAIFAREPPKTESIDSNPNPINRAGIRQAFSQLIRNKPLWFLSLALLFRSACLTGMTGYVPLYLRNHGWSTGSADGTLAAFYAVSTLCVVPLASLSDKIGLRKPILLAGLITGTVCIGLIPFVDGPLVWVMMILSGMFMDGFMALFTTTLMETEGVGAVYYGTALGLVFTIAMAGNVVSPPLGNSLDAFHPALPFVFWAGLGLLAFVPFIFVKETGRRKLKLSTG
jgi:sugar phosphate permease